MTDKNIALSDPEAFAEALLQHSCVDEFADAIGLPRAQVMRMIQSRKYLSAVHNAVMAGLEGPGAVLSYLTLTDLAANASDTIRLNASKALLTAAGLADGAARQAADNPLAGYSVEELRVMQAAVAEHRAAKATPVSAPKGPLIDHESAEMLD